MRTSGRFLGDFGGLGVYQGVRYDERLLDSFLQRLAHLAPGGASSSPNSSSPPAASHTHTQNNKTQCSLILDDTLNDKCKAPQPKSDAAKS